MQVPVSAASSQPQQVRLRSFSVRNFRLLQDVRLDVDPKVTIVVGLNDVGKSTLLEALVLYGQSQRYFGFQYMLKNTGLVGEFPSYVRAEWDVDGQSWVHSLKLDPVNPEERLESGDRTWVWQPRTRVLRSQGQTYEAKEVRRFSSLSMIHESEWKLKTEVPEEVYQPTRITYQFLTPEALLFEPSQLTRAAQVGQVPQRNGFGWAWYLQTVINRRDEDIQTMEGHLRRLFPSFHSVVVREVKNPDLKDKEDGPLLEVIIRISPDRSEQVQEIPARMASSGLLLALAHFSVAFANRGLPLLLLEEPENGLNPKITFKMMETFLQIIRERQQQLVLTTHNAWWLDLVPVESIRVMTRDDQGAKISTPAPERLRALIDKDIYPSELMSVYGPEGLLNELEAVR